jgi:hypothetical protein
MHRITFLGGYVHILTCQIITPRYYGRKIIRQEGHVPKASKMDEKNIYIHSSGLDLYSPGFIQLTQSMGDG